MDDLEFRNSHGDGKIALAAAGIGVVVVPLIAAVGLPALFVAAGAFACFMCMKMLR